MGQPAQQSVPVRVAKLALATVPLALVLIGALVLVVGTALLVIYGFKGAVSGLG